MAGKPERPESPSNSVGYRHHQHKTHNIHINREIVEDEDEEEEAAVVVVYGEREKIGRRNNNDVLVKCCEYRGEGSSGSSSSSSLGVQPRVGSPVVEKYRRLDTGVGIKGQEIIEELVDKCGSGGGAGERGIAGRQDDSREERRSFVESNGEEIVGTSNEIIAGCSYEESCAGNGTLSGILGDPRAPNELVSCAGSHSATRVLLGNAGVASEASMRNSNICRNSNSTFDRSLRSAGTAAAAGNSFTGESYAMVVAPPPPPPPPLLLRPPVKSDIRDQRYANPAHIRRSHSLDIVESSSVSNSSNSSSSNSSYASGRTSASILDNNNSLGECQVSSDRVFSGQTPRSQVFTAVSHNSNGNNNSGSSSNHNNNNSNSNNNNHNNGNNANCILVHSNTANQFSSIKVTSVCEPRGWKRISTNNVIIYISPSSTALGSLGQLKEYLTTPGTCKCGLECPFRPERVFNFDPKVATRPWSPERGKTREMNKLCNHKRKIASTTGAASPIASSTPNLAASAFEASMRSGSPNSVDSMEQLRKDGGLSRKKKRKIVSGGNIYCGVTTSQIAIQDPSTTHQLESSIISKNPRTWPTEVAPSMIDRSDRDPNNRPIEICNTVHPCGAVNSQQRLNANNMTDMLSIGKNASIICQRSNNQQQQLHDHHQQSFQQEHNIISNQMPEQRCYSGQMIQQPPQKSSQHFNNQHKIRGQKQRETLRHDGVLIRQPVDNFLRQSHVVHCPDDRFQIEVQGYDPSQQPFPNDCLNDRNMDAHRINMRIEPDIDGDENHSGSGELSRTVLLNQTPMHHQIVQNGTSAQNVHTTYQQEQLKCSSERAKGNVGIVDRKMHQELMSQVGRNTNEGHNADGDQQDQTWQQIRGDAAGAGYKNHLGPMTNVGTCLDRVPPLHHHIPQVYAWNEELAKKKPKASKGMYKKQRQHHVEPRSLHDQSNEKFQESRADNQACSNGSGPSFLEDPSGYLAQQTALLNSTISRQTGRQSSDADTANVGIYVQQHVQSTLCNSVKNHATSPVLVHSSSIAPSENVAFYNNNNNNNDNNINNSSNSIRVDDTCYIQYGDDRGETYRADQPDDPVTSSTFADRFSFTENPVDPRPIQGGTVSTSYGSPASSSGGSLTNSELSSQPATPRNSSEPSTPPQNSQPATPYSSSVTSIPTPPLEPPSPGFHPMAFGTWNKEHPRFPTAVSSSVSPSPPLQTLVLSGENVPSQLPVRSHPSTQTTLSQTDANQRDPVIQRVPSSAAITMASGHTYSSNTITSVLAGKANTATVSINAPSSVLSNPIISNIASHLKPSRRQQSYTTGMILPTTTTSIVGNIGNSSMILSNSAHNMSKSPLEMVQSVVSSIQVPQSSTGSLTVQHTQQIHHNQQHTQHHNHQQQQQQHQQSNIQMHNVLAGGGILKQTTNTAASFPPGHILVSSGGQLIMASTGGSGMPPPQTPAKIMQNGNSMPPLSVSPMVSSGTVSQIIPPVGVAQQMMGQPTVLVNTIQAPVLIQPGVMTMEGIGQNVQMPHLTMATSNVLQNHAMIDQQDAGRNHRGSEPTISKKKVYKKRKNNSQTVASMLQIASSQQQNSGMLVQSQSNFAQQNFQSPGLGGPVLQALTIVPGKAGAPAQLVMNSQASAGSQATQFNTQQIITNPSQQINLLQPVNLLNGATGINFPTIQQFIVPGLGSMVMSADGTATLLQDTGNLGMQLQIQNVNGQNVLTPVQSHSAGLFAPGQGILATGPAGMVIRAPQGGGGKLIQQQGAQFISPNSGQFLVNGTTSFGNQLSPIVASVNPNQQITFNTSRPSQGLQTQQEFIQMNGQTLMVPCATSQNIAVSSAAAAAAAAASQQQNTTFVQQNTTIVQQQTTMVSNSQISGFQTSPNPPNNRIERSNVNQYVVNPAMTKKLDTEVLHNQQRLKPHNNNQEQIRESNNRQHVLSISSSAKNQRIAAGSKNREQNEQYNQSRHSVSTQTAAAAAAAAANRANSSKLTGQGGSPPDTTTHSPGNSQRSNSPAVDTTTHGSASPALPITSQRHSSSTPMVHCITSSEPDSGDVQPMDDWRMQQIAREMGDRQRQLDGYVESTVSTGIQIYASETSEQTEGVMSTMMCEGRGIKRKLTSMHSILHEDQDVSSNDEDKEEMKKCDSLEVGQLVWGAALGSPAWPGKVETVGPQGSSTVGVRWYGAGAATGLTHVQIKSLKSLSDGLEAHHRARKKVRKSRKLNMQLEKAIQEAMSELDRRSEKFTDEKHFSVNTKKTVRNKRIKSASGGSISNCSGTGQQVVRSSESAKATKKQYR